MPANKLIFESAEKARDTITKQQKQDIAKLYDSWGDEIGELAKHYNKKTTASSPVSEAQAKQLKKQLKEQSKVISEEVQKNAKSNLYMISDAVVLNNKNWLASLGFDPGKFDAAFSSIPQQTVNNIVTGKIYKSGWSLSGRIWGNDAGQLKDVYGVVAKGLAQNKSVYDIAKNLEAYVKPGAKMPWNLQAKDGVKIFKKQVDYNAQRLVRTLTQHGYQQTFIGVTQQNPFITSYIWDANGSRACELCLSRDGKLYAKDQLPMDHPNGMCTMIPDVVKDLNKQLADWFNADDGTFPQIDNFAKEFGYNPIKVTPKVPPITPTQMTQSKVKSKYLLAQGFDAKNMPKSFEQWVMKLSDFDKADVVQFMIDSGKPSKIKLNMLKKFYNENIEPIKQQMQTTQTAAKVVTKTKAKATVTKQPAVKVMNELQEQYLKPYGFDLDNLPGDFSSWASKIGTNDLGLILDKMGTNWSDPHPYQQIEKFFNEYIAKAGKITNKLGGAAYKPPVQVITPNNVIKTPATPKKVKVKAFTGAQDTYLKKYGYTVDTIPDFKTWDAKASLDDYYKLKKVANSKGMAVEDYYNKYLGVVKYKNVEATKLIKKVDPNFDALKWESRLLKNNTSEFAQDFDDWMKLLLPHEENAVGVYTGYAFRDINRYLRGFTNHPGSYADDIINAREALQKAKTTKEFIGRRGSDGKSLAGLLGMDEQEVMKLCRDNPGALIGQIASDKGFFSMTPDSGGGFGGSVEYIIKAPEGSQGVYVDSISRNKGEQEFLLNTDSNFIIHDVQYKYNGVTTRIFMEHILHK